MDTTIKVLLVEQSNGGGHAHYASHIVKHVGRTGAVRFTVLGERNDSEFARLIDAPYRTGSLWRAVREENPDIVHLFPSVRPWIILPFLIMNKLWWRKKTVYTIHNIEPHEWKGIKTWIVKVTQATVLRLADIVVVQNELTRKILSSATDEKKLRIVLHGNYCWFDNKRYTRSTARTALKLKPHEFMVLFFGEVRPYKGVTYVIEAARKLPNIIFYIVGKVYEPFRPLLEPLPKNVLLVDKYIPQEDVELYYKAADVNICPYLEASTSGPIQIAIAMKTPLIATDVDSMPEIVGDVAVMIPPKNSMAIVDAIQRLQASPTLRKRLKDAGYHKATVTYAWEKTVDSMQQAYAAALQ